MPDPRRIIRRIAESALPARLISHLSVVALVAVASLVGATSVSTGATASEPVGFLNLVSSVRGAGDEASADALSSFVSLPADEVAYFDRAAPAVLPQLGPLPTPVPLDPDATPLPAPTVESATERPAATTSTRSSVTTAPAPPPAPVAVGGLVWPVPGGVVTQGFHGGHLAIDIAADYGAAVVAAQSGVVTSAGWRNNGGGQVIEIDHGNGMVTLYNHLGSIWVTAGQAVLAGQGIAGVGCSGLCTGPHVHFQVIVNGVIDNPYRYL